MGYLLPRVGVLNDCRSTAGLGQGKPGRGAGMSGKIGLVLPKVVPHWLNTHRIKGSAKALRRGQIILKKFGIRGNQFWWQYREKAT